VKKIKSQPQSIKSPQGKGDLATPTKLHGGTTSSRKRRFGNHNQVAHKTMFWAQIPQGTHGRGKPNQVSPRTMFWAQLP